MLRIRTRKINQLVFCLLTISFSLCSSISAEVIDRIVALVNDDIITQVELNKARSQYVESIDLTRYSDEKQKEMVLAINKKILNALIDQLLTSQEARRYHIDVSEEEIDNALQNMLKSKSMTQKEFVKILDQKGLGIKDYREDIKKQILQAKLINHAVKSKVIITEPEIKKFYEASIEKYSGKTKYHLRNILMDNEAQIREVKKKLDEKQDFAYLAKKYSMASNAGDGGDLGAFDISYFSEDIKDHILKTKKGEYTDVISTPQGFQIFYVEDIVQDGVKTFDQAKDGIYETLYREKVEKKFQTWLESLKKNAYIKIML